MNKKNKLWTRDFTIITVGTIVSMLGNSLAGFALGLLVLDYTGSTFLYAFYMFMYTFPKVVAPVLAGPYLDKFSRKQTIYILDFTISGVFLIFAASIYFGWFNFPILIIGSFLMGAIDSIYRVAYDSLYPMLISEGNYQKAYSITSVLETITTLMVPVSAFVYNEVGIAPLLFINACTFLFAAILETQIKYIEDYSERTKEEGYNLKKYFLDFKEGLRYLSVEKGLLAICIYFSFLFMVNGVNSVLQVPYFRRTFENGEYVYMLVMAWAVLGRFIGGTIYYKFQMPTRYKFTIAFCVYISISLIESTYLFCPLKIMYVLMFLSGIMSVTSYNIRISATQSYVPHERKGRFNGIFEMLSTVGMLSGEVIGGSLSLILEERIIIAAASIVCILVAFIAIGGNKTSIKQIYNRES